MTSLGDSREEPPKGDTKTFSKRLFNDPAKRFSVACMVTVFVLMAFFFLMVLAQSGWRWLRGVESAPQHTYQPTTLPPTKEERIKQDVTSALGSNTNRNVKKIRDISIAEYNGILVVVHYNADDNLKTSMIQRGIWMDDIKVFKKLYQNYPEMKKVGMMAYFPLMDQYGNTQNTLVSNIVLDKETADKINWDNFITDNLPRVADSVEEHLALKT